MIRNWFAGAAAVTLIAGFAAAQGVAQSTESSSTQTTVNSATDSSSSQTTKTARTNPDGSYEWSKETDTQTHSVAPVQPQVVEKSTTTTVTPPPVVEQQTRRTTTTNTSE